MAPNRRGLRNEAAFLPTSVEDLAELRRRIVDAGHPAQTASGIVGWLVAKTAGDPDPTSAPTRSQYRKILAELEPLHGPDPEDDRRLEVVGGSSSTSARRHRGRGMRKALVALVVAGSGLVGAGTHQHGAEAAQADATRQSVADSGLLDRTARGRRSRRGRKLAA